MNIDEIREGAPSGWYIGGYAAIVFYLMVFGALILGCVVGYLFYPIVSLL